MREELVLGERIGGIDAQVGEPPGRLNIVRTADFYPVSDPEAVGDTRKETRGHIQIPLRLKLCPEVVTERHPGNQSRIRSRHTVIFQPEVQTGTSPRDVMPALGPGQLKAIQVLLTRTEPPLKDLPETDHSALQIVKDGPRLRNRGPSVNGSTTRDRCDDLVLFDIRIEWSIVKHVLAVNLPGDSAAALACITDNSFGFSNSGSGLLGIDGGVPFEHLVPTTVGDNQS
ncbi:hypothetical protein NITHO_3010026 [Nitrolancea hollandica Lb]|uniref:Uncharacterized protein n=1 Tax=Nitrolancea hollandica Lb TaxID=1129897 RepID=I4EH83_9BACT|nr:hypothetical protein NITHO_3010026 [Nitrolancea hollandica Lb]